MRLSVLHAAFMLPVCRSVEIESGTKPVEWRGSRCSTKSCRHHAHVELHAALARVEEIRRSLPLASKYGTRCVYIACTSRRPQALRDELSNGRAGLKLRSRPPLECWPRCPRRPRDPPRSTRVREVRVLDADDDVGVLLGNTGLSSAACPPCFARSSSRRPSRVRRC